MRLSAIVLVLAGVIGTASPAAATNWAGDGWFFHDKDSITRSGDIVTVNEADCHGVGDGGGVDVPTSACAFNQTRINCATGEKRNLSTGATFILESWTATMRIYCPQKPAAAVQPATPAATKPVQSAPAKATAGSDLKDCETSSNANKARIAACTRIIESKNPGLADLVSAHANRCLARHLVKEKVDDALVDCNRALTLDPKSYVAVRVRGILNSNSKRLDAALADFTQTIALKPQEQTGYYDRGIVHVKRKDLPSAVADFTAMHQYRQDEAFFHDVLCWARTSINAELQTALSNCERVVQLKPEKAGAYEQRARVRLRLGQLKEARADCDKALSLDKNNGWALYTRALVNQAEGKTEASRADYMAAIKLNPSLPEAYNDIGLKLTVQPKTAPPAQPQPGATADKRLQMLKDGCAKGVFSPQECKEAGIVK